MNRLLHSLAVALLALVLFAVWPTSAHADGIQQTVGVNVLDADGITWKRLFGIRANTQSITTSLLPSNANLLAVRPVYCTDGTCATLTAGNANPPTDGTSAPNAVGPFTQSVLYGYDVSNAKILLLRAGITGQSSAGILQTALFGSGYSIVPQGNTNQGWNNGSGCAANVNPCNFGLFVKPTVYDGPTSTLDFPLGNARLELSPASLNCKGCLSAAIAGYDPISTSYAPLLTTPDIAATARVLKIDPYGDKPSAVQTSAANAALTINIGAVSGKTIYIYAMLAYCSVSVSGATPTLTVTDGATVIWSAPVPAFPSSYPFQATVPIKGSGNTAMTIAISACGAGSSSTLSYAVNAGL